MGVGRVRSWIGRLIEIVVFDVGYYTDNFLCLFFAAAEIESLSDWLLAWQKLFGKCLVDQNDAGCFGIILGIEETPAPQRGTDRVEVLRRCHAHLSVRLLALWKRYAARDLKSAALVAGAERDDIDAAGSCYSG